MAELSTVVPEDYDALSKFLAGFPGEERDSASLWLQRFAHWWDNNPAFEDSLERGWLLRSGEKIGGFVGNIPSQFQVGGRPYTVYNGTAWRVLPELRTHSFELLSRLIWAARESVLFVTTPKDNVIEVLRAMRFQPLSEKTRGRSVAVTSLDTLLQWCCDNAGIDAPAVRILGTLASWIPPVWLRKLKSPPGTEVKRLGQADEAFDELWDTTKNQYENTNVRGSRFVNWYCFGNVNRLKKLFGCYRNGKLVGYLICGLRVGARSRYLECYDLWTHEGDIEAVKALLCAAAKYAREIRCGSVTVSHFNCLTRRACSETGMLNRRPDVGREYMRVASGLAPVIRESNSYLVKAQGDYGL